MRKQEYPEPAAGAFIKNKKGELLLVKSYEWKDLWHVPGGHIEVGERITDTVRREVMEEVGLKVKVARLISVQEAIFPKGHAKKKHFIYFDFLCEAEDDKVKLDKTELREYRWVSPKTALKLKTDRFTKNSLKMYLTAKYPPLEFEKRILTE